MARSLLRCILRVFFFIKSKKMSAILLVLASRFQSHSYWRNLASLLLFYKYLNGICSHELIALVPRHYEFKRSARLAERSDLFTIELAWCNRKFYANIFFSRAFQSTLIFNLLSTVFLIYLLPPSVLNNVSLFVFQTH